MLTVGVIGAGYWGTNHLRVFNELPEVDLQYCADLSPERRETVRHHYPDVTTTADYEDLYDAVDAVCVSTPPQTHEAIAVDFLERDVHVLVEKPLALDVDAAEHMAAVAADSEATLMVGHIFEHHQAVRDLRGYVEDGELGDIHYLYAQRTGLGPIRNDVSALWDLCPHDISIFRYLLDTEPVAVRCIGHSFLQENHDAIYLFVEFADGPEAVVQASWLHPKKTRQVTVVGDEQMAVFDDTDPDRMLQLFEKTVDLEQPQGLDEFQFTTREGDVLLPYVDHREPLKQQARHFVNCIETGQSPLTDATDGLEVVQVLAKAEESLAKDGAVVEL